MQQQAAPPILPPIIALGFEIGALPSRQFYWHLGSLAVSRDISVISQTNPGDLVLFLIWMYHSPTSLSMFTKHFCSPLTAVKNVTAPPGLFSFVSNSDPMLCADARVQWYPEESSALRQVIISWGLSKLKPIVFEAENSGFYDEYLIMYLMSEDPKVLGSTRRKNYDLTEAMQEKSRVLPLTTLNLCQQFQELRSNPRLSKHRLKLAPSPSQLRLPLTVPPTSDSTFTMWAGELKIHVLGWAWTKLLTIATSPMKNANPIYLINILCLATKSFSQSRSVLIILSLFCFLEPLTHQIE